MTDKTVYADNLHVGTTLYSGSGTIVGPAACVEVHKLDCMLLSIELISDHHEPDHSIDLEMSEDGSLILKICRFFKDPNKGEVKKLLLVDSAGNWVGTSAEDYEVLPQPTV